MKPEAIRAFSFMNASQTIVEIVLSFHNRLNYALFLNY